MGSYPGCLNYIVLSFWPCKHARLFRLGCRHTSKLELKLFTHLPSYLGTQRCSDYSGSLTQSFWHSGLNFQLRTLSKVVSPPSCWWHFISVFPWVCYIPDIFTPFPLVSLSPSSPQAKLFVICILSLNHRFFLFPPSPLLESSLVWINDYCYYRSGQTTSGVGLH